MPQDAEDWNALGLILQRLGKLAESIEAFDKAIRLYPNRQVKGKGKEGEEEEKETEDTKASAGGEEKSREEEKIREGEQVTYHRSKREDWKRK